MKILFLCTHNACRSILAEAIARQLSNGRIIAASAGSSPAGAVHPLTLQYLNFHGYNTEGLTSKSWDDVREFMPDVVITVCDQAADESCPVWFGNAVKAHWGLSDPSRISSSEEEKSAAFSRLIQTFETRLRQLLAKDIEHMDKTSLQSLLAALSEVH